MTPPLQHHATGEPHQSAGSRISESSPAQIQRPRWRRFLASPALRLALLVLVFNILFMPRILISGDPWAWREETRSILRSESLSVDATFATGIGEPGQFFVLNPSNGRWYSKYGIMNSIMAIPPTIAEAIFVYNDVPAPGGDSSPAIFDLYNALLCALLAAVLYHVTGWYSQRPWLRFLYVLACLYATFLWFYQRAQSGEIYQVLFFTTGFWLLIKSAHAIRSRQNAHTLLLGASACFAALVLTRVAFIFLLPIVPLVIAYSLRMSQQRLAGFLRILIIPPLLILGLLALVNTIKFGSPWLSGYHQWHPDQHRLVAGMWREGVYGYLFSTRWSIFIYFPVLIFALLGIKPFIHARRIDALTTLVIFGLSLLLLGSLPSWRGEWTYGPRYLLFMLPILSLPALLWAENLLSRGTLFTRLAACLAVAVVFGCSLCQQWQVNRLEFWTVHRLAGTLEQNHGLSLDLFRYLNNHTEGTILADLTSHQDDLRDTALMHYAAPAMPASAIDSYMTYLRDLLKNTNFYWSSSAKTHSP